MKAKFGAIVVDGRGKIGGHVASKNRAGSYFRTKVSPSQPASLYSANVRARLSGISVAWRGLTEAQRTLWNNAVNDWKKTDIFGDVRNPSGFNLYQMLNNNILNVGGTAITTPPLPSTVPQFATFTVAADNSDNSLTITFTPAIAATEKVKLFATAALSGGKNFVKSEFRQISVLSSTDTSPFVASTVYQAKFGAIGATGKKIAVMAQQVKLNTGQVSGKVQAICVIQA